MKIKNNTFNKIITLGTIITVVVIVFIILKKETMEVPLKYIENSQIDNSENSSERIESTIKNIKFEVEPVSLYIEKLNLKFAKDLSFDLDSVNNEVDLFAVKYREDSIDVIDKINMYLNDPREYQIQLSSIVDKCRNLNTSLKQYTKSINENNTHLTELALNEYYFYQGINDSKICNKLGGEYDPFWVFLKLAREGDELAQLLLIDNLWKATNRKLLDVKKYPIKFMDIRDESVMYLQNLAAKGVHRASERLGRLYSGKEILPRNPQLEYYYYFLASQQNSAEINVLSVNLSRLYNNLSDRQKQVVDRMTDF